MARISFQTARNLYKNRYTMEHVPSWAKIVCSNGKFYAPQFASDLQWYENTKFPGEKGLHGNSKHCRTSGATWPLGQWLDSPYNG